MNLSNLTRARVRFLMPMAAWTLAILALFVPLKGSGTSQATDFGTNKDLLSEVVLAAPASLSSFYQHPIFHASRQPFVAAPPPAPAPVIVAPPAFALAGRLTSRDGVEFAYVTDPGSGETLKLELGDQIGEWTLSAFQDDGVLLSAGDKTIRIGPEGATGSAEGAAGNPRRARARTRRGNN